MGCYLELDAKQKVLLAIYTEYQKDIPNMEENLKAQKLGLEYNIFKIAVDKLQNEDLINGAVINRGGNSHIPAVVSMGNVKMTRIGIDYVEHKLEIERTLSGAEKVKTISENAAKWGWEQFKDITAKVLAEIASKAATGK